MNQVAEHQLVGRFTPGGDIGASDWIEIDQEMITQFGITTLDPDPMHIDPDWAVENSPYRSTIAYGFLTTSLLTTLLHSALGGPSALDPAHTGHFLNYGFDRMRLVAPVPVGARIQGRFTTKAVRRDERNRFVLTLDCVIAIEGSERPALVADWLAIWVPPSATEGAR